MTLSVGDFESFHEAVHGDGRVPFPWQSRLLREVVERRSWPAVLDLPTGSGKTTCIDIALFALALDSQQPQVERWCPRRIAMVVDRRIVVDQVAERGRHILRKLSAPTTAVVANVAAALRSLSRASVDPLAVFTLRGGMPKDDSWARTPDQPLIIASTVDQLGSRLLVQGYGVTRGMKSVHAGLLGNDLLLLLDEVHLSQPFAQTLDQLGVLRGRFTKTSTLPARFHRSFLSATPGVATAATFRLEEEETRPDSTLGVRLYAKKPVQISEVAGRTAVELACVDNAFAYVQRHDVVAVVVNRVASARIIARQLREKLKDTADVVLLTGRMRPLDRDDVLRDLRPRVITGRDRSTVERKLVVVGTQCIEAGADFDFDALVTEAASLDALRQRFGRVDRVGGYGKKAEGVIVRDKQEKDDPIYGGAIAATTTWLKERLTGKAKEVDFGVLALKLPADPAELLTLLAPKPSAPILLPAYLDLWMQSSPAPTVVPDVSLWLHGPQSGPADVQVIWRADLSETILDQGDDAAALRATSIVAAARPSSLESISVSYTVAKRWLEGDVGGDDMTDAEGGPIAAAPGAPRRANRPMKAFRWDGDQSEIIDAESLEPGDTIVVPASRGGIADGTFDPSCKKPVEDLAERAALQGRGLPILRLHPAILAQHGLELDVDNDTADLRAALTKAGAGTSGWRHVWLGSLASGFRRVAVEDEEPWAVLEGRRIAAAMLRRVMAESETLEDGVDLASDEDDSSHAGKAVTLAAHSTDVERFAREYGSACGLPDIVVSDLALAGWLHDIGKADPRFQLLLRGGSEIELFKDQTLWAKSAMPAAAKSLHRLAQRRSGYPAGARHELLSVAMITTAIEQIRAKAHDLDLVLHLVASHHGYCRPFAPVAVDEKPTDTELPVHASEHFGKVEFRATSSDHQLHRLDSPVVDCFWRLVARYGWHELCWLECILRLADHRASEFEQTEGDPA
ncbi:MAG: type I-U CRISPR-associated helicase/endonuclease Cas3 [Myxococcota bacterium]|nr:type I-U CRISPR-associated helicase/endonuclease Cas3 [Myxococcota bacterium]